MMDERSETQDPPASWRVHIYASGRGFVVVPVCHHSDESGTLCQPIQNVTLTRGYNLSHSLKQAIERAARTSAASQPEQKAQGRWQQHHLFAVCVQRGPEELRLLRLPDMEPLAAWPATTSIDALVKQLIEWMAAALA